MRKWPVWTVVAVLAVAVIAAVASRAWSSGQPQPLPTPKPDRTTAAGSVGGGGMGGSSSSGSAGGTSSGTAGGENASLMSGTATYTRRDIIHLMKQRPTQAQREAAAAAAPQAGIRSVRPTDYLGATPNWANSPLAQLTAAGKVVPGTGIRKFVDALPLLGIAGRNGLGQYIPVAVPDTLTFPGSDYYVIAVRQYSERLHSDLPRTRLRGYVQLNRGTDDAGRNTVAPAPIHYLGPMIVARRDRPVRIKFVNLLPREFAGNLFLPIDLSVSGAGQGPLSGEEAFPQNRAVPHLHGGVNPWISDGSPHQWITPATEMTSYAQGVGLRDVPDMWFDADGKVVAEGTPGASNDPGPGATTLYFTNQQSARLMFIHDQSLGIDRLNVYAGEAAGYLLTDDVERELVNGNAGVPAAERAIKENVKANTIPAEQMPLIIQDKSFVPDREQLTVQDPTWDSIIWGRRGSLWFPHVYMPNQNPYAKDGVNAMGRWNYGPWVKPPYITMAFGPVPNPLDGTSPTQGAKAPGTPNPSIVPDAFMDTMLVNGTAYPYVKVKRKAYRLRILNACNDRFLNLQLYYAKSNTTTAVDPQGRPTLQAASGEVPMVPAKEPSDGGAWPRRWPTDGRAGGVPAPAATGPSMIQIGTEGGILPQAVVLPNTPVGYVRDAESDLIVGVDGKTLFLGPAERADVIVDFSDVPAGSKLILYNDAPAPVPAPDPRVDYYTGGKDMTATGGAPSTPAGYGPNTRTIMQFQVEGAERSQPFDLASLRNVLPAAFAAAQDPIIVPQPAYDAVYGKRFPKAYARLKDGALTFVPADSTAPLTLPLQAKSIQELFDTTYGRMNATLGVELPHSDVGVQTTIPLYYSDPPTEIVQDSVKAASPSAGDGTQIWKITHNGIDTHVLDFHLFNVQVVDRVTWDGDVHGPDPNELGWKGTVRVNPLEVTIVALRPVAPTLPFKLPNSVRLLDPTRPKGSSLGFSGIDPLTGNATPVTNQVADFGWEYTWHSHLLGREDNDMMRPVVFQVAPAKVARFKAGRGDGPGVVLTWKVPVVGPAATHYTIQRATDRFFSENVEQYSMAAPAVRFRDSRTTAGMKYFYRGRAENAKAYSAWSTTAEVTVR